MTNKTGLVREGAGKGRSWGERPTQEEKKRAKEGQCGHRTVRKEGDGGEGGVWQQLRLERDECACAHAHVCELEGVGLGSAGCAGPWGPLQGCSLLL